MRPCECPNAGLCPRYGREMPPHLHQLCQTRADYRVTFAKTWGDATAPALPVASAEPIELINCDQAGRHTAWLHDGEHAMPVMECKIHGQTTPTECGGCPDRSNPPEVPDSSNRKEDAPKVLTLSDLIPATPVHPAPKTWAVGLTTAPRIESTLERCLTSVVAAGFEPRIFAEPDVEVSARHRSLPVTHRSDTLGAFPNFILGLHELLERHPLADAYVMLQDDILLAPGTREYLEAALWPEWPIGFVSLYTSAAYAQQRAGWHKFIARHWQWGACAFVWSADSARSFLGSEHALRHRANRANEPRQGLNKVDTCVGLWAATARQPVWFPHPSLAQHIGDTSTIWSTSNKARGTRRASSYVGDSL